MRSHLSHSRKRYIVNNFALAILSTSCAVGAWAQQLEPTLAPPIELVPSQAEINSTSEDVQSTANLLADESYEPVDGATPLMQGPIHEAFAERFSLDEEEPLIVTKEPPQLIDEQAPEYRPDGEDIEWIPGYWGWDITNEDFVWVSGVWRQMPPGQQWIPGYWTQAEGGWRWINGFWMAEANEQIVYLPPPPQSIDNGPSSAAPGADFFWVSGNWLYNANNNYVWKSGYWHPCHDNWVWVPARYVWTPSGYVYRTGYWDFEVNQRGMLFAPVAFRSGFNHVYRPVYVIETSPILFANLYVTPGANCYYFGSAYARSARRPCYPWVSYYRHGYDPLFSYYVHQPNQRNWLRSISSLQNQMESMPNPNPSAQHTVAEHMRHHHPEGAQPGVVNQGGLGTNAMLHVAALTALAAAKNSQKVDFKTPFSVTQTNQNKMVTRVNSNAAQLNEFAKKRRELEVPSSPGDKANALVRGSSSIGQVPKSNPTTTLKQIELIKPNDKSRLPRDLKVGAGLNATVFSNSIGAPTNSVSANNGGVNASNKTNQIGRNNNLPNVGAPTNVPGATSGSQPGPNPTQNVTNRLQRQSQQLSQILSGDKTPLDAKRLEALRSNGANKSAPANNAINSPVTGNGNGTISNQGNSRKVPSPPNPTASVNSGLGTNPPSNAIPGIPGIGSANNGANTLGRDNLRRNNGPAGNMLPGSGAGRIPGNIIGGANGGSGLQSGLPGNTTPPNVFPPSGNVGLPGISNPPNVLPPSGNGIRPPTRNPVKPNNGVGNSGLGSGAFPGVIPGNNLVPGGGTAPAPGIGRPGSGLGTGGGRGVLGNGGLGSGGLGSGTAGNAGPSNAGPLPRIGRSVPGAGDKAVGGNNRGPGPLGGPNAGGNRPAGNRGNKDANKEGKK